MIFLRKAQAAVEYIFIVALSLMLIVPGSIVFYRFSADSQSIIENSKVFTQGTELISVAEELYSLGDAWETIDINLPDTTTGIWLYNGSTSELSINFNAEGPTEVVFFTHVPIFNSTSLDCTTGCRLDVTPGANRIRIESGESGQVVFRLKE